jgi:hypothetical protein
MDDMGASGVTARELVPIIAREGQLARDSMIVIEI